MNKHELEPLSPEVADLLAAERARPEAPYAAREALLASVERTLGLAPPPGGGSGGSPSGAPPAVGPTGGGASAGKGVFGHPYAIAATTAALGGLLGLALTMAVSSPTPKFAAVEGALPEAAAAFAAVEEPSTPSETAETPVASSPTPSSERAPRGAPSADGVPGRDRDLAAERALLDTARSAVARGQGAAALEALRAHARQFPRGRLSEEREVLTIQALSASGHGEEARGRAERFKKAHPGSLMVRAVDAVLGDSP